MVNREEMDYFCMLCDLANERKLCPPHKQKGRVLRGKCPYASIEGMIVYLFTKEDIQMGNNSYSREQVLEMAREAKRRGKTLCEF